MASRLFHIYDVRKTGAPAQERENNLKYMTRSLACMPNGENLFVLSFFPFSSPVLIRKTIGYATASVEG